MTERPTPEYLSPRPSGQTGLQLPPLSLGLWQNFGRTRDYDTQRELILAAFDAGIWHFDNANRYGPPHGWAEEVLGKVLASDLRGHRNHVLIATKAGNPIATGPYGRGGSRKHMLESLDDSLRRLGLDHVDVFYSHSRDESVPLEETAGALVYAVETGRTHYVGISNYDAESTSAMIDLLERAGVPLAVHQHKYSLLHRAPEADGLHDVLAERVVGGMVYSPLAQGLLTDRYLAGNIPAGARAESSAFLNSDFLTEDYLGFVRKLNNIAQDRAQTLAQLALQWVMRSPAVTTTILGVSSVTQLHSNLAVLDAPDLDESTLAEISAVEQGLET